MCTVGFWKDKNNIIHYFKNRDLKNTPINQQIHNSTNGIILSDDSGKYEGLNNKGVFIVGLTLKPLEKQKNMINNIHKVRKDALLFSSDANEALSYIISQYKKNKNFCGSIFIGDSKNIILVEAMFDKIEYIDLSNKHHFVCTNYSTLLQIEGNKDSVSYKRLLNAEALLEEVNGFDDIIDLLSNHSDSISSICRHEFSITRASYIVIPKKKSMYVCEGNPCEQKFIKYHLSE